MAEAGLDEGKLEQLRGWGSGLRRDARVEVAAAGRAILLLIDEIERLHILLRDKRLNPHTADVARAATAVTAAAADPDQPAERGSPYAALWERLHEPETPGPRDTIPQPEPRPEQVFNRQSTAGGDGNLNRRGPRFGP